MIPSALPVWVQYVQALAAPFATITAALVAAAVTYLIQKRQWKTSQDKLKLDLFDKRFSVYRIVRGLESELLQHANFNADTRHALFEASEQARFLFGEEISRMLNDIRLKDVDLARLNRRLSGDLAEKEREKLADRASKLEDQLVLLVEQADKPLSRYLDLSSI